MKAERKHVRKSRIDIVFYGKSVRFPIHFRDNDYLEKVFKKISAIEESRELSRHSSGEDLTNMAASAIKSGVTPPVVSMGSA